MRLLPSLLFVALIPTAYAQQPAPTDTQVATSTSADSVPSIAGSLPSVAYGDQTAGSKLVAPLAPVSPPPDVIRHVPAIDVTATMPGDSSARTPKYVSPPPPVNLLSGTDSELTQRESKNVAVAKRWIDGSHDATRDVASSGAQSAVVFRFGGPMPSIVCAVGYICDVALQPGESVNTVSVGDPVRWKIAPATSGTAPAITTHVVIKPSDIGLSTNLLVTTDRRVYAMKLVSRKEDFMPTVSFSYPEDEAAQWSLLAKQHEDIRAATVLPDTGESISTLDFGYRVKGDSPHWRPLRVYSDGVKTFIQFPKAMAADEAPALVAIGADKQEQMVNYRLAGDRYIVDKVLDRAILVSGVGRHQVRVKVEHAEDRQ